MQCTPPSLPAAAAAARGAYRATNSACPKAEQDPCKAVCNSFPLLPLAYSNSAASSIWYSSSSSIVVQGSLGNFLIIKIESLLLLFLSHFSLQLCFTILFCSLFLFFFEWHCWGSAVARVVATKPSASAAASSKAKQRKRTDTAVGF